MPGLLDLPSEVILIIVEYLQANIQHVALPFYELGDAHRYAISHNPPRRVRYLRSLLLVSRRLSDILTPILYRNVIVRDYNRVNEKISLDQLQWSLEKNPSLSEDIVSAFIPCGSSWSDRSIGNVIPFFWYANMQTLTIHQFDDWEPLEFENDSHVGTSPVKYLTLIDCGAHEESLAAVLSWPAALKALHYDANQGEWSGHYGDEPAKEWTTAAFVRTLQSQKRSLEELTMTRPRLVHEGLGNGPRIDLSDFQALRILRIYHVFLCGTDDWPGVWRNLPPNLEELEVSYDDGDLTTFLYEGDAVAYDPFLLDVIRHKTTHLPHLHTVTIYAFERFDDSESESQGIEDSAGHWKLPSSLASEAEAAGIKLDVWLKFDDSPTFEGVDVFESLISQTGPSSRSKQGARSGQSVLPSNLSEESSTREAKVYGSYTQLQF
ncbi:uncharacterized protein N7498_005577 [Penicillium cinerascens]|uniref:Uncharacterized protein n=1 Tax=Penicillium cinerascens TaxID=70096 RepID=A0A9W9MNT2_9EURO|nr:uncharacterized protein N7498_005577 [Penicillium cinerascens]KAJ5204698.1 hypothetical protein N7498_005577 [Penicillium cinerascens]